MSFSYADIFKHESPEELHLLNKKIEESISAAKAAGDAARSCINTEAFQTYKRSFEIAESKIVDAMIAYTHNFFQENNGSLDVYGANMARYITKIQDLKSLLTAVEVDSKKGLK